MFFQSSTVISLIALVASATPIKRATITDTDILQYALTLEHLENDFYSKALASMDENAFAAAGFPDWVRGRFSQIAQHEATHVTTLQGALGSAATAPCNYSFPYTDPTSFAALSQIIENVGVSAYLGAAKDISTPGYVTVAASILTLEARHQAWVNAAVENAAAWSGPNDTPLGYSAVYSIAAAFITGCPSSNPTLPVTAFPAATISQGAQPGQSATLTFKSTGAQEYLIVYSGLTAVAAKIEAGGKVTLPAGLQGISYGIISTTSNTTEVSDANTVAGPLIMSFSFSAWTSNPQFTGSS